MNEDIVVLSKIKDGSKLYDYGEGKDLIEMKIKKINNKIESICSEDFYVIVKDDVQNFIMEVNDEYKDLTIIKFEKKAFKNGKVEKSELKKGVYKCKILINKNKYSVYVKKLKECLFNLLVSYEKFYNGGK